MKNIFKIMGLALIAGSLMFTACKKDETDTNNDTTNNNQNPETYVASVAATLDGTALDVNEYKFMGENNGTYIPLIAKRFEGNNFYFPGFYLYITGTSKEDVAIEDIDLYNETYLTMDGYSYGDWQLEEVSNVECTVFDATTMRFSANVAATMYSLSDLADFYETHGEEEEPGEGDVRVQNFTASVSNLILKK